MKKTIRDIQPGGKRVLVRVDFNVPLERGRVADDTRIRAALPTIRYLLDRRARVVLMSHLGRPKGRPMSEFSLAPVAQCLSELLGHSVDLAPDCVGPAAEACVAALEAGQALLLENLRFHPEEEANDPGFSRRLAVLGDVYVNDAFGSAHRAHASTVGVTAFLPAVAGLLMEKELAFLGKALENPARPFVAILGGAKISDKIGVIRNLLGKVDRLLIGGGMANTFLKALGIQVGQSLVESGSLQIAAALLRNGGGKIVLPLDAVIGDRFAADAARAVVQVAKVPLGWSILDIGPATVERFAVALAAAKTVVWNGPMGVFEFPPFAEGTFAVARVVAGLTATTIIGGGDSAAAVELAGLSDKMTHVSTGGGATLEFLEGRPLPGVEALQDS